MNPRRAIAPRALGGHRDAIVPVDEGLLLKGLAECASGGWVVATNGHDDVVGGNFTGASEVQVDRVSVGFCVGFV